MNLLHALIASLFIGSIAIAHDNSEEVSYSTYELRSSYNLRTVSDSQADILVTKVLLPKGTWVEFATSSPPVIWDYELEGGEISSDAFFDQVRVRRFPADFTEMTVDEVNQSPLFIALGIKSHIFVPDQSDFTSTQGFKIYRSPVATALAMKANPMAQLLKNCLRRELTKTEIPESQLNALVSTYTLNLAPQGEEFPDELEFELDFKKLGIKSTKRVEALRERRCSVEPELNSIYNSDYITVVNYGLTARTERKFVIDVRACEEGRPAVRKMIVAHGRNSSLASWSSEHWKMEKAVKFSNTDWSKQSSIGYFLTGATYDPVNVSKFIKGLALYGLESTNDLACERDIIVHGAQYVEPAYVEREGFVGRSWGCPAIARDLVHDGLLNELRGGSLYVILRGPDGILQ